MTCLKYILILYVLFLICSCQKQSKIALLPKVDSLINASCADSALSLLKTISLYDLNTPDALARYALLMTQAKDKNYVPHTSDSLIRIAVSYYDATSDRASQAKAHYYLGRVYQDMGDEKATIREFLIAMPLAEMVNDYELICLLQANIGYIYWSNALYEEANSLYKRAIDLAEMRNDSLHWVQSLFMYSIVCMGKGEKYYPEAEESLMRAHQIMKNMRVKNLDVERQFLSSFAFLYERTDRETMAIAYTKYKMIIETDSVMLYEDYMLLGSAYTKLARFDSATYYLNQCLLSDNYGVKEGAYMRLADIAQAEGRENDALIYENKSMIYKDSATLSEQPVEIITLSKDIIHKQVEYHYLSFFYKFLYFPGALTLGVLCWMFWSHYKYKQHKREADQLLHDKENVSKSLVESLEFLEKKENEITTLRQRVLQNTHSFQEYLTQTKDRNEQLEQQLVKKDELIFVLQKKKFEDFIQETSIYDKFLELIKENKENPDLKKKPETSDWDELICEVNRLLPGFLSGLERKYEGLLKNDIHFCCLIRMGFKKTAIQYILSCSLDAVYKHEQAILKRMNVIDEAKLGELLSVI